MFAADQARAVAAARRYSPARHRARQGDDPTRQLPQLQPSAGRGATVLSRLERDARMRSWLRGSCRRQKFEGVRRETRDARYHAKSPRMFQTSALQGGQLPSAWRLAFGTQLNHVPIVQPSLGHANDPSAGADLLRALPTMTALSKVPPLRAFAARPPVCQFDFYSFPTPSALARKRPPHVCCAPVAFRHRAATSSSPHHGVLRL